MDPLPPDLQDLKSQTLKVLGLDWNKWEVVVDCTEC